MSGIIKADFFLKLKHKFNYMRTISSSAWLDSGIVVSNFKYVSFA